MNLDNDKENENRSALATQAVIQRRRKPKRRSTGVVHIDMDVSKNFSMNWFNIYIFDIIITLNSNYQYIYFFSTYCF